MQIKIVRRSDTAKGVEVLPRYWVVARFFAWINRNRRLAEDFEASIASAEAFLRLVSFRLMMRRLCQA